MRRKQQEEAFYFSATDVAEYEYCSLAWWHDHFEPLALASTDELLARLVELEQMFDTQAPLQPEYQVIEQLLKRRGAFEQGLDEHQTYAEAVAQQYARPSAGPEAGPQHMRNLLITALVILFIAILLVVASLVLR